jgi:Ca-activated chloride channel family protein
MRTRAIASFAIAACAVLDAQPQVFRARAEGVRVSVLVTDRGRPVAGLTAADFDVRDNRVPQRVDVAPAGGSVSVSLVLDVSSSVEGKPLRNLVSGADALLAALGGDRAALVTFADPIDLFALQTTDIAALRERLRDLRAGGSTALVDATAAALVLADREPAPGLILLFSDGQDTTSWLRPASVEEAAGRSESVVYAVTARPRFGSHASDGFLERVSRGTGGAVEYAESTEHLAKTFLRILDEFRHRYVLTYVPTGVDRRGWHDLDIRLKDRRGRVTARRGYWASGGDH